MSNELKIRARSKFRPLDKPGTATIYIGNQRYLNLLQEARKLSLECNVDVKASDLVRFLIDEYSERAVDNFKQALTKHMQTQE